MPELLELQKGELGPCFTLLKNKNEIKPILSNENDIFKLHDYFKEKSNKTHFLLQYEQNNRTHMTMISLKKIKHMLLNYLDF